MKRRPFVFTTLSLGLLAMLSGCATTDCTETGVFALRPGDLLFQDLDCGPLCDAIETVTQGAYGSNFSHMGIVSELDGDSATIIEAVGEGVGGTPLAEFLARSQDDAGRPKVLVGRLNQEYRALIPKALEVAQSFIGVPYDKVYTMDSSELYCSEMIYECFRIANGGEAVFELNPMTFIDPKSGKTFPAWTDYYAALGVPIPEGEPGLNPGGISRAPNIRIVYHYGRPSGFGSQQ